MKTRLLFLFAVLFCFATNGWSLPRTQQEIQAIAKQHFDKRATTRSVEFSTELIIPSSQLLMQTRSAGTEEVFYIFSTEKDGFVIVSADDRLKPILGYSDTGSFKTENLPDNILNWFQFYANELKFISNNSSPTENRITLDPPVTRSSFPAAISPLLGSIAWNQSEPYNNLCPVVGTERTVTGCVATAMAQIMMYHKYPDTGQGTISYSTRTRGIPLSANFANVTFKWNKMQPTYQANDVSESANCVAELMYNCGLAVEMDYNIASVGGSGAYDHDVPIALIDYFKYDENMQVLRRDLFSYTEWLNYIKTELTESRPIYYTGQSDDGGHAFVADGYDNQDLVHINWGWGSSNNGYFEFTSLDPESHGIGGGSGGYSSQQYMIVGFQKPNDTTKYKSHFGTISSFEISSQSIARNGKFSFTWNNIYNFGMPSLASNVGVALYENGVRKELLTSFLAGDRESLAGWGRYSIPNLAISNAIPTGNYQLHLVVKDSRDNDWVIVRAFQGEVGYFNVDITNSQIAFTAPNIEPEFTANSFESLHKLYAGGSGDYKINIHNNGAESLCTVGILFQSTTNPDSYSLAASVKVTLITGVEKELTLSGISDVAPGNYKIIPAYLIEDDNWGLIPMDANHTVTVHAAPVGTPSLSLTKTPQLAANIIKPGEPLVMTLSIKNDGAVYDDAIYLPTFEVGGSNSSVAMPYKKVFIDAGETAQITFTAQLNITKEGNYIIQPRYYTEGAGLNNFLRYGSILNISFSVNALTGIINETTSERAFIVYPTPVDDVLNIKAAENIRKIELFNASGNMIKQVAGSIQAGGTCTIAVSDLPAGIYFLQIQTDDNVYSSKFIKK